MMMLLDDDDDKSQFEELYNKYKNEAYHIAYRILCDNALAEDAVADAFLSLARSFKTVVSLDERKQHGYIVVTVSNAAKMILRKGRRHFDDVEFKEDEYVPDEEITVHDRLWIKECMRRLCEADREILYLKYSLALGHGEIALALGISQEASRKRLRRSSFGMKMAEH